MSSNVSFSVSTQHMRMLKGKGREGGKGSAPSASKVSRLSFHSYANQPDTLKVWYIYLPIQLFLTKLKEKYC